MNKDLTLEGSHRRAKRALSVQEIFQAIAIGVALALCSLPFAWSALFVLPLAVLFFWLSASRSPKVAYVRTMWAMSTFFAGHLIWLPLSFYGDFGGASVGFVGLWLLEGFFFALLTLIVTRLTRRPTRRVWLLAGGWIVLEWLRHLGPLAFPWATVGYTLMPTPLIQIADLGGVLLLSLLVTTMAASLARAYSGEFKPLIGSALSWILALLYGIFGAPLEKTFVHETGQGTVTLVQGNLDARAKRRGDTDPVPIYLELSKRAQSGDLVVWPESAVNNVQFPLNDPKVAALLPKKFITGYGTYIDRTSSANRVISWDGTRVISSYDKHFLVPLGEFFPLQKELPGVWNVLFTAFGYAGGLLKTVSVVDDKALELGGERFGAYVCYESIFPQVSRAAVLAGADVLVNVSNDGWYGVGSGIDQHFQMGRLRAIETRRFILRAGNVGVTAILNSRGVVQAEIPRFEKGTLRGEYKRLEGETPYVKLGDWPLIAALLLIVWTLAKPRRYEFRL